MSAFNGQAVYVNLIEANEKWNIQFTLAKPLQQYWIEKGNKEHDILITLDGGYKTKDEAKIFAGYHMAHFHMTPFTGPNSW